MLCDFCDCVAIKIVCCNGSVLISLGLRFCCLGSVRLGGGFALRLTV